MMMMGSEKRVISLSVVLMVVIVIVMMSSVNGQSICNVSISGLMACKPSVTLPNPATPSADCCSALSHADLRCLCSYKNSKLLPSLGIDPNLALQLPSTCKLPHLPRC